MSIVLIEIIVRTFHPSIFHTPFLTCVGLGNIINFPFYSFLHQTRISHIPPPDITTLLLFALTLVYSMDVNFTVRCLFYIGELKQSLGFTYRISPNLLSSMIPEVCNAICSALMYLKIPSTEEGWLQIQADYYSLWHFPSRIEAMDGKRVLIA